MVARVISGLLVPDKDAANLHHSQPTRAAQRPRGSEVQCQRRLGVDKTEEHAFRLVPKTFVGYMDDVFL